VPTMTNAMPAVSNTRAHTLLGIEPSLARGIQPFMRTQKPEWPHRSRGVARSDIPFGRRRLTGCLPGRVYYHRAVATHNYFHSDCDNRQPK
jgi:hypothetical protein